MKQTCAFIVCFTVLVALRSPAEPLRVAWCRLGAAGAEPEAVASTEQERAQWREVADGVRKLDADVVVVAGLRHRGAAVALAQTLRPGLWQVAVCSTFRVPAGVPPRQVAILARSPAVAAWTEEWRGAAQADLPGGFAFAAFRSESDTIGVFALEWEAPGASRAPVFNAAAHEAAAKYVLHHADWVNGRVTNGLAGLLVSGWHAGRMSSDHPLARTLASGGFRQAEPRGRDALRAAEERRATGFAFTRKGELVDWVRRPGRVGGDVTWIKGEFVLQVLPAAPGASTVLEPGRNWHRVADFFAEHRWEMTGGMAVLLAAAAGCWRWLRLRARVEPGLVPPTSTYVVEIGPSSRGHSRIATGEAVTASGSIPPAGEVAHVELWRRRALLAESRVRDATEMARVRVLPLFAEVLKLRLFRWLTDQRNHLIATQRAGTQQMVEMERRLAELQTRFQVRLQQDQDRIAGLERDLAAKERTIRDLLRARARSQPPSLEP